MIIYMNFILYLNSQRLYMKVFSKNHKNNKSSPALQSLFHTSTTGKTIEKKPKGINKIKTFKQILT